MQEKISEFVRANFGDTKKWEKDVLRGALTDLFGGDAKVPAAIKIVSIFQFAIEFFFLSDINQV